MTQGTGFSPLAPQRCALLIIDVQEKLMPVIYEANQTLGAVKTLARFAGITGMKVLVTEQEKLGSTLEAVACEVPGFTPISKVTFSCFGSGAFCRAVDGLNVDTLVLAGVESHICVAQTALAARTRFDVHVVSDAVSSRAPSNKQVALDRLRASGVTITSTEMFLYEVLGQAGTPEFKKTLPLVK